MSSLAHPARLLFAGATAAAGLLLASGPAQADPYTGTPPPKVLGVEFGRSETVAGAGSVRGTGVRASGSSRTGSSTTRGGLPVTGSDVLQLTVLGLGTLGAGTVLVRKSRKLQVR